MIVAAEDIDDDDDEVPCLVQVEKASADDSNYLMIKIPVTILAGFLGSGNYLLLQPKYNIAI